MNYIFDLCVKLLSVASSFIGLTYKEINVVVFCIIWPILTAYLVFTLIKQKREIRNLKNILKKE